MTLELSELAAGLPMAASLAMAGGIGAIRDGRRRGSLNEAMHELRRPLQALTLALSMDSTAGKGAESSLGMAVAALERLDREINGGGQVRDPVWVSLRPILEAAMERWQGPASHLGRSLSLRWQAGDAALRGDPVELAQAVDNLISNALQHGDGEIRVDVNAVDGVLRLVVLNDSCRDGSRRRRPLRLRDRIRGRSRHGHGTRIVRRAAARHAGSFGFRRHAGGAEARLELPLAGGSG